MASLLTWHGDPPALRRPVLLIALEGFVDAGAVASTASMFLRHRWKSEPIATFDRDALLDYRARRPTAIVDNGVLRRVEWQDVQLHAATVDGPRDVVLLLGPEPDMRWTAFFDALADACKELGVESALGLGAYPAAVPHTRPPRILQASNGLEGGLETDAPPIRGYTGPVGAGTAVHDELGKLGIPAVGLWAEVPHYVAGSPHPGVALEMVRTVAGLLGTDVETTELESAASLHREQIDEAVADHDEAVGMVEALERHVDEGEDQTDLPTGEDLAAELERFLRQQE